MKMMQLYVVRVAWAANPKMFSTIVVAGCEVTIGVPLYVEPEGQLGL
jgi:hypothetical protein